MASLLKLPEDELKPLYTRLLLVKELIHPDIAGVVLSLEYRVREKIAIHKYNNSSGNAKLLEVLESRFVNPNIAFKIGMSEGERDTANGWFAVSRIFLENKKDLSAENLLQYGYIHMKGLGCKVDTQKALELFDMASQKGCIRSYLNMGGIYRDGLGLTARDDTKAVSLYENCLDLPLGKSNLAYMLYYGRGCVKDVERAKKLYIQAAGLGDSYALKMCKELRLFELNNIVVKT